MMLKLDQILPLKLGPKLIDGHKQIKTNLSKPATNPGMRRYTVGMKDFAIHLSQYPEIIVLDLDVRPHKWEKYIDSTYTHKTRKGWHLFFKNTTKLTTTKIKQNQGFDLLAGDRWLFYSYDNPDVAQYTEYNQLPINEMPAELWEQIKELIRPDENKMEVTDLDAFTVEPLIWNHLNKVKNLYNPEKGGWNWKNANSSEFAWAITNEVLKYTDVPAHHKKILTYISDNIEEHCVQINPKHLTDPYIQDKIRDAYISTKKMHINFRPVSDFRTVHVGGKLKLVDTTSRVLWEPNVARKMFFLVGEKDNHINRFLPNYKNSEFMPGSNEMFVDSKYNLFHGFIKPIAGDDHLPFLEYVKNVVCSGHEEWSTYLLNYLAHMVQVPQENPRVAIVLMSDTKGNGKDTLHVLLSSLLVDGGYVPISREMLIGRFNAPMANCLIGAAEELSFGGSHNEDNAMKTMITRPKHIIERKNAEPEYINNYMRLFITSNYERPVKATDGERRYFVLKPSKERKGDTAYWDTLYKSFELGMGGSNLLYYLLNRDIGTVFDKGDSRRFKTTPVPDTPYLHDLISSNTEALDDILVDWWADQRDGTRFTSKNLFQELEIKDKYMSPAKLFKRLKLVVNKDVDHFKKGFNTELGNHWIIQNKDELPTLQELIDAKDNVKLEGINYAKDN